MRLGFLPPTAGMGSAKAELLTYGNITQRTQRKLCVNRGRSVRSVRLPHPRVNYMISL
jgi:hypothetical protein